LLLTEFLHRARELFPTKEIVQYRDGAPVGRYPYRDYYERVLKLAGALRELGIRPGDRVATLAWNHHRHLELYLAVPLAGAVLHTINLRLEPGEIGYILEHADDRAIVADTALLPAIEQARAARRGMTVVATDGAASGALSYEDLLEAAPPLLDPPTVGEDDLAALCYTSGTTGRPKGVGYSHRSLYLHTFAACLADGHAISERDTVLHVVPMFHANAWGIPFAALMSGANQILPGPHPVPGDLAAIIEAERATYTGMVPTVAADLLQQATAAGRDLSSLRALVLGGSAPSEDLLQAIDERFGIPTFQGWGMTEISPMGTFSRPTPAAEHDAITRRRVVRKQGRLLPGLRWRLLDDSGREQPHDGVAQGELLIRGPWVASSYFRDEHPESFTDGWLRTGDIATIDPEGYLELVDRAKDLIKSGGEWISSAALEQALCAHPAVAEAAVIAIPHQRWQERPLAVIVPHPGEAAEPAAVLAGLREHVPRWWLPDRVLVVDALPRTSVGKLDKKALRDKLATELPEDGRRQE
jgi:fatty-acyl-CoA synthase